MPIAELPLIEPILEDESRRDDGISRLFANSAKIPNMPDFR
jgi:hypothetical protein